MKILISEKGLELQIPKKYSIDKKLVYVVSPAPVLGFSIVEMIQKIGVLKAKSEDKVEATLENDTEAWSFHKVAYYHLFSRLSESIKKESNSKNGTCGSIRLIIYGSPMALYNSVHHAQPQPGAIAHGFCGEKGLEYLRNKF